MTRCHQYVSAMLSVTCWGIVVGCTFGHRPKASGQEVFHPEGGPAFRVEAVATGLTVPWEIAWTPDGTMLVTERSGRLVEVDPRAHTVAAVASVAGVDVNGEHGLMGIALSPTFAQDHTLYLSYTGRDRRGQKVNRIARFTLADGILTQEQVLVDNLPASDYHDGLPLALGPDGKLYASTGDATQRELAQKMDSLAGKFLRLNPDGSIPDDNPFAGSPVWSLGHRNCQGFDWRPGGDLLYATEHGPSFGVDGMGGGDEVNLVTRGGNYGWPIYHHDKSRPPYIAPLKTWTPAIAPAGAAFYTGNGFPRWNGAFFLAGLRGEALWVVTFSAQQPREVVSAQRLLHQQYGRLRAVSMGPDGYLYFSTSNRDSRGRPAPDDDKILRLVPAEE